MKEPRTIYIPSIIVNFFIILISLYLSFLFIKSKSFHTYPCYNIIAFSVMVSIVSILRNIPVNKNDNCNLFEKYEAFFIIFFDKLIICTLSMQSVIYYCRIVKTKFFYKYEKKIFFITFFISLFISITLSAIFVLVFNVEQAGIYCYCKNTFHKRIIDSIFVSIYFLITLFCTLRVLIYIFQKKREVKAGLIQDLDYNHHFNRSLMLFFLNVLIFIISYILNYDIFRRRIEDLLYMIICFATSLFNSLNRIVYKETLKIFCKKIYDKKYNSLLKRITTLSDDENTLNEDDNDIEHLRTRSF